MSLETKTIIAEKELKFKGTDNALTVLQKRYLKRDKDGNQLEEPEDLFKRVAANIASAEALYSTNEEVQQMLSQNPSVPLWQLIRENDEARAKIEADPIVQEQRQIYSRMMMSGDFMPNSPTLMNAGRDLQQLSACFVLPVGDSMEEIFDAVKHTAMIHKSGGGTGFSFSRLRPSNDPVMSTQGVSSGPISFMKVFNIATDVIKQGGTRRGANMGILRADHPDILHFIKAKVEQDQLNNFNISVGLTEEFMQAVVADENYQLINPRDGEPVGELNAKTVFEEIVDKAWRNGEPGIIFLDRMNANNPTPQVGEIESTNPCGEQPLLPYESCNLGSINLSHMLVEDKEKDKVSIDWDKLGQAVHSGVRFLDNVIDMNKYPLDQIDDMTKANRKIGLGVMDLATALVRLEMPYGSEESYAMAEKIMEFIDTEGKKASEELATQRGLFPNYEGSALQEQGRAQRNATVTTIAPTGTISMIADAHGGGVEPIFALSYVKNVMDDQKLYYVNPDFERVAKEKGFWSEELAAKIEANHGSVQGLKEVPEDVQKLFVTAHDLTPEQHIRMQATIQKHTDNAVSKTINFPEAATRDDIRQAYLLAFELGCKGLTVYRDGSRDEQVMTTGASKIQSPEFQVNLEELLDSKVIKEEMFPMLDEQTAMRERYNATTIEGAKLPGIFLHFGYTPEGFLNEIFITQGSSGGKDKAYAEGLGRLLSVGLQYGIAPQRFIKALRGIESGILPYRNVIEENKVIPFKSIEDLLAKRLTDYVFSKDEEWTEVPEHYVSEVFKPQEKESRNVTKREIEFRDPTLDAIDQNQKVYLFMVESQEGALAEVFINKGRSGTTESASTEALGKLTSILLRHGVSPLVAYKCLAGIHSPVIARIEGGGMYQSLEDGIGREIARWHSDRGIDLRSISDGNELRPDLLADFNGLKIERVQDPCPGCESTAYTKLQSDTRGHCGNYSCCGEAYGNCTG
ncbi:adenosylcobalamin-dependent ribonucleoside-diphosphate reductase [Candidatus Woesearchaeota archaeon]|nr:adenosylcobalamin-dependent ribonucleoside-diphosphate reductase [Candidatus Woesearchaeota archaeon]